MNVPIKGLKPLHPNVLLHLPSGEGLTLPKQPLWPHNTTSVLEAICVYRYAQIVQVAVFVHM